MARPGRKCDAVDFARGQFIVHRRKNGPKQMMGPAAGRLGKDTAYITRGDVRSSLNFLAPQTALALKM